MLLMEAYEMKEETGEHKRVVSQIRKSSNRLSPQEMADYFDVTEQDCVSVLDCIREHPDWDDRQVAEEVYWDDD